MEKGIVLFCFLACCASALAKNNEMLQCLAPPRALQIWYPEAAETVIYEEIEMHLIYNKDAIVKENARDFSIKDSRILFEGVFKVSSHKYRLPTRPNIIPTIIRGVWSDGKCKVTVTKDANSEIKFASVQSYDLPKELEEELLMEAGRCLQYLCAQH